MTDLEYINELYRVKRKTGVWGTSTPTHLYKAQARLSTQDLLKYAIVNYKNIWGEVCERELKRRETPLGKCLYKLF